jgi:hypothetical protein
MAKTLGMSDEDIAAADPVALEAAVLARQEERNRLNDERFSRLDLIDKLVKDKQPEPTAEPVAASESTEKPLALDEAVYEKAVIDEFKSGRAGLAELRKDRDALRKEIADIKASLADVAGYVQRKSSEESASRTDSGFAGLGEKFHKILGKGTLADVNGTPALQRRMQVLNSIKADPPKVATWEKAIQVRSQELFGDLIDQEAPKPSKRQPEPDLDIDSGPTMDDWNKAGLTRPTNRVGAAEPAGEAKATNTVRDFQRNMAQANGTANEKFVP